MQNQSKSAEAESLKPILERFWPLVFENGISCLEAEGHKLDSTKTNPSLRRRFLQACHYGYDLAQRQIGRTVIEYELEIRTMNDELSAARRGRDKKTAGMLLHKIALRRRRQLVLRRFIDSILYGIIAGKTWVLRQVMIDDEIRAIDPRTLQRTLEIATEMNREDRMTFNLVCDLSTVVQVGDLVQVGAEKHGKRWEIIELKEGKVNQKLSELLNDREGLLTKDDFMRIRQELGEHAPKQAARMIRQQQRQREVTRIIETDKGTELKTHLPMVLYSEVEVEDYSDSLRKSCQHAQEHGYAVAEVDHCFRLAVFNREMMLKQGIGGVAHIFFHLQKARGECKLNEPGGDIVEREGMRHIWPFLDLAEMNLHSGWAPPIFMWPMPKDMILAIVTKDLFLFGQLDFDALFHLAAKKGVQLSWATGKQTENIGKISSTIPGSPGAKGVSAKVTGEGESSDQVMMSGFFARAFLEFMSPTQMIHLIREGAKHAKRGLGPEH